MIVFSAGAFVAMLAGLQLVGAVRNAIIGVLEPLTVAVLAYFFLDEPVTAADRRRRRADPRWCRARHADPHDEDGRTTRLTRVCAIASWP